MTMSGKTTPGETSCRISLSFDRALEKSQKDTPFTSPPPAGAGDAAVDPAEEFFKPKTLQFWLVILSTFVCMFLVALDRTILATAIPRITDEFKSLGDIGWYGSAYMLATAAFQLVFGRIYRFYSLKWTLLATILIFEIGSAICGAALSSPVFIFGRAVAGVGSAGIMTGCMMTIIPLVPLHKRPMFQAMFGIVFGVANVSGPLIGGAFTDRVTWRWCFYLNLPIGAAAFAFLLTFKFPAQPKNTLSLGKQILNLDLVGTLFFVPAVSSLLLALEWGGSTYAWSSWRIIVLFVCSAISTVAFTVVQVLMPESASLPIRVIKIRTVYLGALVMLFLSGAMMLCVYYIPFWYKLSLLFVSFPYHYHSADMYYLVQTTHGINAVQSGIYTIPLVLSLVVASIFSGALVQRLNYPNIAILIGACITMIGEGLLTTFVPKTGSNHWIGYQFLAGFGFGFGMQAPNLSTQAAVTPQDIPTAMAIMFFAQQLGGAVFVTVGQTILSTSVVSALSHIPGLDAQAIVRAGATELHRLVQPEYVLDVVNAYNQACITIFRAALALSAANLLVAAGMPWLSIKKEATKPDDDAAKA